MKAILYQKQNKTPYLVYQEVKKPTPKEDEVLIKVKAVSLNATDYRSMMLKMIPKNKIFGADIAGIIEAVGSKCHMFRVGDEVLGDLSNSGFGGLAEYATAKETAIIKKPINMSFEVAASIPMAGTTALQGIRDIGKIKPKQSILIYGSGGGVGTFAVQLATYFEAQITAVCGSSNVDLMNELGAQQVLDYQKDIVKIHKAYYDVILAINGHQSLSTYRKFLRKSGRLVVMGGSLSQILKAMLFGWIYSFSSKKVFLLKSVPNQNDLMFLADRVEQGDIRPILERIIPLEEVPNAFFELAKGHARGKIIVAI